MKSTRRVLSWRAGDDWRAILKSAFLDGIGPTVVDAIRRDAPRQDRIRIEGWLDRVFDAQFPKTNAELSAALGQCLVRVYTHIRAYHGCRPTDIESYATHGLYPFTPVSYQAVASAYFSLPEHDAAAVEAFTKITAKQAELLYTGEVAFHLDQDFITQHATYYLIYGSHSLLATSILLSRATGHDYKRDLAHIGRPTIVQSDIPVSLISQDTLNALAKTLLVGLLEDTPSIPLGITEFELAVPGNLFPQHISGYSYPTHVTDVLYNNDFHATEQSVDPQSIG
jgi:hypothetical protein